MLVLTGMVKTIAIENVSLVVVNIILNTLMPRKKALYIEYK